jgi:hypothetical protein
LLGMFPVTRLSTKQKIEPPNLVLVIKESCSNLGRDGAQHWLFTLVPLMHKLAKSAVL